MIYLEKQRIYIVILLLSLSIFLTGCSNQNTHENLEEKVNSEIEYIDVELIKIISKLNNINFSNYMIQIKDVDVSSDLSDESTKSEQNQNYQGESNGESKEGNTESQGNENKKSLNKKINVTEMVSQPSINTDTNNIDWQDISSKAETLSNSWNTIILDLYKLNITSESINNFSNLLDQILIAIEKEDKTLCLSLMANLYGLIPKFIDNYSDDSGKFYISTTKWHILNAYVGVSSEDWALASTELSLAEQAFSNVMKNEEYMSQKEYSINRIYIGIKELQTSNQYTNPNLFFLKYRNAMQELENI